MAEEDRPWWEEAADVVEDAARKGLEGAEKGLDAVEEALKDDAEDGEKESAADERDEDSTKDEAEGAVEADSGRGVMRVKPKSDEECVKALEQMRDRGVQTLYIDAAAGFSAARLKRCLQVAIRGDLLKYQYSFDEKGEVQLVIEWGAHINLYRASKNRKFAQRLKMKELKALEKANAILEAIVKPEMTPEQIVLAIHDYVVQNTTYDTKRKKCDALCVLLEGRGVCEGYAHATALLLKMAGIECRCVFGYAGNAHIWNLVKLHKKWYHLDVTWDDPVGGNTVLYDYFLISDNDMRAKRHKWLKKSAPETAEITVPGLKLDGRSYRDEDDFIAAVAQAAMVRKKRPFFRAHMNGISKKLPAVLKRIENEKTYFRVRAASLSKRPKDIVTIVFEL